MKNGRLSLLVICPVYNEEASVLYFFDRLKKVLDQLDQTRYEYRLLFTNNRSTDATLDRIQALEAEHSWIYHLTLSRNFGYQLSVLSGLTFLESDLYMVCDVDCEDPPEMLLEFLQRIEQGSDIVYGIRNNRPDTFLMTLCRRGFYTLLRRVGDFTIIPYMAEFCMLRRAVRNAVIAGRSTFPFLRSEIGYAGFEIVGVPYRREARRFGKTHYNYFQSFQFAWAGILASTTLPLRAAMYGLPPLTAANVVLLVLYGLGGISFQVAMILLVGLNVMFLTAALAFVSIYVARIYHNSLGRDQFIVDPRQSNLPRNNGEGECG